MPLAYCRLVSESRGLDIYFKKVKHDEFISLDDLSTNEEKLISSLIECSSTQCNKETLKKYIADQANNVYDPYQLANGHDVAAILGIALRKLIGCRREVHTWASEIKSGLRLAFDWEKLTGTQLFQFLKNWEAENKRYRIFRDYSS